MKRMKIAQIGMGHDHAAEKLAAFRAFPQYYEAIAVAEPDVQVLAEHGGKPAYAGLPVMSMEELLTIPGLEAVLIETDVPDLTRYAQLCVDRGLHIHMDKPAGEMMSEYTRLMNDAQRKGLLVQMGYMYRGNDCVRYALEQAHSNRLGKITAIDAQMSCSHPLAYRRHNAYVQGGTMLIFGCHLVDLIVTVMGEPNTVHSVMRKTCTSDAYDNTLAVLEYPDAACVVRVNSLEINGFGRRQFVICGTEGTVELKLLEKPTVMTETKKEDIDDIYQDIRSDPGIRMERGRYDVQVEEFYRIIRGDLESPYSYAHDLAVHRTVLRCCGIDPNL